MGHHFNVRNLIIPPSHSPGHPYYEVIFINTDVDTNSPQVRMKIPVYGMFTDPNREITPSEVQDLADGIAHYISQHAD